MTPFRAETVILNWLIALPFFAALCAELFPRLRLPGRLMEDADSLRKGPFALGALASLMGVGVAAALLPAARESGAIGADYWWTHDLYHRSQLSADSASIRGTSDNDPALPTAAYTTIRPRPHPSELAG